MNWTPGPWEVIGRSIFQKDEVGGRGVLHGASVKGASEEEIEANIRLIAAAPELLEALENILNVHAYTGFVDQEVMEQAEEIIRKAKGE